MQPNWHPDSLADRMPFLQARVRLTNAARGFFASRGYTEVETPYAVPVPGEEVHLQSFATVRMLPGGGREALWLHTSPEFAMKRLLVAGSGPIFQMARVWRNGERSDTHAPEFTMLEWYRPGGTLAVLMDETEALLRSLMPANLTRDGQPIRLGRFERLTMAAAFRQHCGADLLGTLDDAPGLAASAGAQLRENESWEDLFFRLLLERIEPAIGRANPTFLTHWPASQAALAARDPADPRVALRFELFAGGLELANAFEELTDPAEQRARFTADRTRRHAAFGPDWELDEDFLSALDHGLPPCSGIALGFDRLVMLATGAKRIDQVQWLPAPPDPM